MAGSGSVASSGLNHAAMLMGQLQGHYSGDTAAVMGRSWSSCPILGKHPKHLNTSNT